MWFQWTYNFFTGELSFECESKVEQPPAQVTPFVSVQDWIDLYSGKKKWN